MSNAMTLARLGGAATLLLLAACGNKSEPPADDSSATPAPAASAPAPAPAPAKSEDAHKRVADSLTLLFTESPPPLGAYHVEMQRKGPEWDKDTSSVKTETSELKADVEGDSVHLQRTTTLEGTAPKSFDGYVIKRGMANTEGGGKELEVKDGKAEGSFGVSIAWATVPLELLGPVTVGSAGARREGEEEVSGRKAEKYSLDSDRAPAGVMAMLGGDMDKLLGNVWVDAQTGALLKLVADYQRKVLKPDNKEVAGTAPQHVELLVTNIGATKVTAPQ